MADLLKDRNLKLLLRQRGSSRRKLKIANSFFSPQNDYHQEVKRPKLMSPVSSPIHENTPPAIANHSEEYETMHEQEMEPLNLEPRVLEEQEKSANYPPETPRPEMDAIEIPSYTEYNFQDLPIRQLSSSITSITTIDVLIDLFTNLFQNDLISKAYEDFNNTDNDTLNKLLCKLDLRIFERTIDTLIKDLKDIMDINISNNELCYQLKQILKVKDDLNQQIVDTRRDLHELKYGGELYNLQKEKQNIDKRINLNRQLHEFADSLRRDSTSSISSDGPPENLLADNIENLNESLGIDNGVLTRINKLNSELQVHLLGNGVEDI